MLMFDVEKFVQERCELNTNAMVKTAQLFEEYIAFSNNPIGRLRFVHRLLSLYPLSNTMTKDETGKAVRAIRGIKLKSEG